jgi:Mg/Co/Ni transporter MgtE
MSMAEVEGLSAAFVESHPADAARVLEALPPDDTAGFAAALPVPLAALILRHLGPPYCARVLALLEDAQAAPLLQAVGPQAAARVVQQLAPGRQQQLLSRVPVATSIAIRLLVGYPRGTCGAAMDPWPPVFAPDMTVAEALEGTKAFQGELGDCLFVANGERRLRGVVPIGELVRAGAREPLSAIMQAPAHVVAALASVGTVAGHPGWDLFHALPVVEREDRLVGALTRRALLAALAGPAAQLQSNAVSGAFGAYWQALSALTEIVVEALPPVPAVADEGRKDER